ncbi:hypothetical protein CsSME_00040721 [Camellia sinensis var. sinensis]
MASYSQFGFHCTADQTLLLQPRSIFRSHASMTCSNSISVRFQDDLEISKLPKTNGDKVIKVTYKIDGSQILEPSSRRAKETGKTRKSLKARILSRVFSEDYERVNRKILDPREPAI